MAVVADIGFSFPPCPANPVVCNVGAFVPPFGPYFSLVFRNKPALLKTLVFRLRPLSSSPWFPLLRPQHKYSKKPSRAAAMIAPIAMPADAPPERWLWVLLSSMTAGEEDSAAKVATAVTTCVTTAPLTVIRSSYVTVELLMTVEDMGADEVEDVEDVASVEGIDVGEATWKDSSTLHIPIKIEKSWLRTGTTVTCSVVLNV